MNASNQRHSMPFYISPRLFRNKRLRQRRCKWAARLKKIHNELQLQYLGRHQEPSTSSASLPLYVKTDRQLHQLYQNNKNRHYQTSLQADVTINLLSDDDNDVDDDGGNDGCHANDNVHQATTAPTISNHQDSQQYQASQPSGASTLLPHGSVFLHPSGSFQLSMVPNITLVPVQLRSSQNQEQQQVQVQQKHNQLNATCIQGFQQQMQHQVKSFCNQEIQQQQQIQHHLLNQMQQLHQKNVASWALEEENAAGIDVKRKRKSHKPRKRYSTTIQHNNDISIVVTDDDDEDDDNDNDNNDYENNIANAKLRQLGRSSKSKSIDLLTTSAIIKQHKLQQQLQQQQWRCQRSSPPPLAPLSSSSGSFHAQKQLITSETIEEVTVSLVPRTATTASCSRLFREQHAMQPHATCTPIKMITTTSPTSGGATTTIPITTCSSTIITNGNKSRHNNRNDVNLYPESNAEIGNGSLVDDCNIAFPVLPDETTVHTVIANRIYELSLSKLREGLASSGIPEFANESTSIQKLSPTQRQRTKLNAAGQPIIVTPPPAPISLKLSSDLSISLISDDDENDSAAAGADGDYFERSGSSLLTATAHKARAAVRLLQQQHPQLSVVQHLEYKPGLVAEVKITPSASAVVAVKTPVTIGAAATAAAAHVSGANAPTSRPPPLAPVPNAVAAMQGRGITPGTTTAPRRRKLG